MELRNAVPSLIDYFVIYMTRLMVFATHPIQYIAPVLQEIQARHRVEVTAVYGSDFSVAGYKDKEFGTYFQWDTNLVEGYTVHFLEKVAEGGATSVEALRGDGMTNAIATYRPDVILLTGYQGRFHRRAMQASLQARTPLLLRAETTDHAVRRSRWKQWGRDVLLRWWYQQCAVLLPIGSRSEQHYQRLAPRKPCIRAPYCVDTGPFQTDEAARASLRPPTRQQLGLNDTHIAILFSGKLIPKKNPLLLVEAIKQLPETVRQRVALLFLGDGELKAEVEALSQTLPSVAVRFLGFHNQTALSPYYHAADLLVLPSAWGETWGLVVNEALHHGLPVVVSDQVGCAPDVVRAQKTGFIFPSESVDGLRTALIDAITTVVGRKETRDHCRTMIAGYTVAAAADGIAQALRYVKKEV